MLRIPRNVGQGQPRTGGGGWRPTAATILPRMCRENPLGKGGPSRRPAGPRCSPDTWATEGAMGAPAAAGGGVPRPRAPLPLCISSSIIFSLGSPRSGVQSAPLQQGPAPLAGNWPDALGVAAASLTQSWKNGPCLALPYPARCRDTRALEPDLVQGQTGHNAPGSHSAAGVVGRGQHPPSLPFPCLAQHWVLCGLSSDPTRAPHRAPDLRSRPAVATT